MTHRKPLSDRMLIAATALLAVLFIAIVVAVRLVMAGGDLGCMFSADPALCAAVKEFGR